MINIKIGAIDLYTRNQSNPSIDITPKKNINTSTPTMQKAPIGCFDQYAISFGRDPSVYAVNLNSLNIRGLTCPYCGRKMIPIIDLSNFFEENKYVAKCQTATKRLEPYKTIMHKTEREVFEIIKVKSRHLKHLTLRNAMLSLAPNSLTELIKSQTIIFNKS